MTPQEIYRSARDNQLEKISCIRMLRQLFGLSLVEAKEIMIVGDGLANSLAEYQEKHIPVLEELLKDDESFEK